MPEFDPETERIRSIYNRRSATAAPSRHDKNLEWLCSRADGDVLEVGVGRGRTFPYYPQGVRLHGIELSDVALGIAQQRALELGLDATLRSGDATSLPFPDDHFDTVVFAYVLCTVPDDRRAVAEAVRVLRPGGRLLLVEHVRSTYLVMRSLERLFEPLAMRRWADHLLREPLNHVMAEGLTIETLERHWLGVVERIAARKPQDNELAEAV